MIVIPPGDTGSERYAREIVSGFFCFLCLLRGCRCRLRGRHSGRVIIREHLFKLLEFVFYPQKDRCSTLVLASSAEQGVVEHLRGNGKSCNVQGFLSGISYWTLKLPIWLLFTAIRHIKCTNQTFIEPVACC